MADAVRVEGYRELLRALKDAPKDTRKEVRAAFRHVGEAVRADAAQRFSPYDVRSAAGFRVVVRQRGVAVEQKLGKTTGKRPDYGPLQMRKALIPAEREKHEETIRALEEALDRVAAKFERTP